MVLIHIAVRCKDNKEAAKQFYNLRCCLEDQEIHINRLDYANWIVGSKICRVRFYSNTGSEEWRNSKVDLAFGFSSIEQRDILKEGRKVRRKFVDFDADYTEELLKYFE